MPRGLQFLLLLLAVPLQYLICEWTSPSEGKRAQLVKQISKSFTILSGGMFEWQKWPEKISKWMRALILLLEDDDEGECPAEEVIKFQAKNGYFGMSTVPRTPRPKHIQFHVGQVIRHKLWNYRGVIIGWDETMTASDQWTQANHHDKKHRHEMPNYAILVDVRDRAGNQVTYVSEENLEVISNTKIVHEILEEYFSDFDGSLYLARPWLKKVYPHG